MGADNPSMFGFRDLDVYKCAVAFLPKASIGIKDPPFDEGYPLLARIVSMLTRRI